MALKDFLDVVVGLAMADDEDTENFGIRIGHDGNSHDGY